MTLLPMAKYHGCGNDFLLLRKEAVQGIDLARLIPAACHRQTGAGADGFILAGQPPLEMIYYNSDGSPAPMCGNGIRCFARFCWEEGLVTSRSFPVLTGDGVKEVEITGLDPFEARISMGRPDDRPQAVGIGGDTPLWDYPLTVMDRQVTLCTLFMATVHTVWLVEDAFDDRLLPLAEAIHRHPFFPRKTNLNLVQVIDRNTLRMRTWERGAGLTLACGTGACAAALVARRNGLCGPKIAVELPLGRLTITIDPDETVRMAGPACPIWKGEYCYDC